MKKSLQFLEIKAFFSGKTCDFLPLSSQIRKIVAFMAVSSVS